MQNANSTIVAIPFGVFLIDHTSVLIFIILRFFNH